MSESLTTHSLNRLGFNTLAKVIHNKHARKKWIENPSPNDSTIVEQPLPLNDQNPYLTLSKSLYPISQNPYLTWSKSLSPINQNPCLSTTNLGIHGIGSCFQILHCQGFGMMNYITCDPTTCVSQTNTFISLNLQTLSNLVKPGLILPFLDDVNNTC